MKDRISHVHSRTQPYVAQRRPLHAENGTFLDRGVRQSGAPYAPLLSPCAQGSDSFRSTCATTTFPQRIFKTFRSTDSSDPSWTPNVGDGGMGQTCAQFACQTNSSDVTDNPTFAGVNVDSRCCVAKPPQAWTKQADTSSYNWVQGEALRGEDGTSIFPTPNEAAKILWDRGNYDYNPKNYHDCFYRPNGYGSEPIVGAKVYDVDPSACARGNTDTTVAKSIQSSLGLFNTPTPVPTSLASSSPAQFSTPSQAQTSTPAFTTSAQASSSAATTHPAMSTVESSKAQSIAPTVIATTASAGLLSTLAACVTPTPTSVIAASSYNLTVTALSAGLGAAGAGLVVAGAVFAGYRIVQCCKPKNQIRPSHQLNFSRRELSQFELTDTAITNYSDTDPIEEPADTVTVTSAEEQAREVHLRVGTERSTHVDLSTIDLNNHILAIPRRLLENPAVQTGTLSRIPTPINVNVHLSDSELNEHIAVGERIIASPRPVLDNPFGPPLQNVSLI